MDIDLLKQYEGEDADPYAGSMIESFRSIGYSLQTAVADIIDNSIGADAVNVWIDFEWAGPQTWLTITDDGRGMNKSELIDAMRPGSKNPLTDRTVVDLGRFGFGLKTASFSQCRQITVATRRKNNDIIHRCWNLDYVSKTGEWKLLNYLSDKKYLGKLQELNNGTVVIWEDLDHLVGGTDAASENDLNNFLDAIKLMQKHLSMVFHLYMEANKLQIWINNRKLAAWDPYLKELDETIKSSEVILRDGITVRPYVLPHHSKLEASVFDNASGIKGWNAHQGFYIYRNNRLLLAGEWLGMFKQDEHYKLARIMVNVPNTVTADHEWQLDIKKSTAYPPHDIKVRLKEIADLARKDAVEIYRQIGQRKKSTSKKDDVPVWSEYKRNGKRSYQINKDHPVIKAFLEDSTDAKGKLNRLFRLIEETVPVPRIVINESENQDSQTIPFEGKSLTDLVNMIIELHGTFMSQGYSHSEAIEEILNTEPFNHYPELTEHLS